MTTAPRTQATARTSDAIGQRYRWARAYRGGQLVCGRVEVRIGRDNDRIGLTARERRYVVARFLEHVDPTLLADLTALVRRRGAAAKRPRRVRERPVHARRAQDSTSKPSPHGDR